MFYLLVTQFTNDITLIWYTTYKWHFTYKWRYLSGILLTNIWSINYTLLTNTSSINYTLPTNDPLLARYTSLTKTHYLHVTHYYKDKLLTRERNGVLDDGGFGGPFESQLRIVLFDPPRAVRLAGVRIMVTRLSNRKI